MYIHIGFLKHQLGLRKHIPKHYDDIGSILKHQRKELRLTLEEGAEGICSISYLSKVENNLITPSHKYIDLFKSKYHIELRETGTEENEQLIFTIIDSLFYQDQMILDDRLFIGLDYRSKLYHFGYLVSQHNYHKAKKKYYELNPYIKNMNDLEVSLYLYLTALLLAEEGRVKDAFVSLTLHVGKTTHIKLLTLINKEKIVLASLMNNHPYILLHYEKLIIHLIQHEYYHIVHEIKFMYLNYLAQFLSQEDLEKILEKAVHLDNYQKNYILARYDFLHMNYEACYQKLIGKERTNFMYFMLSINVLNKLKYKDDLEHLIVESFETNNTQIKLMIEYLNQKYFVKKISPSQYIKNQILKVHDFPDVVDQLHFWYEEGIEAFKKQGYYKDATLLGQLIFRKIKDLSTNTS